MDGFGTVISGFQTSGDRNGDGILDPKYFIHEMNLTGFTIPSERKMGSTHLLARCPTQILILIMIPFQRFRSSR